MDRAEAAAAAPRFGLRAGLELSVRRWAHDGVVHDAPSNDTFWLTAPALDLLKALQLRGPDTPAALAAAAGLDAAQALDLLQDLQSRGLVQAC